MTGLGVYGAPQHRWVPEDGPCRVCSDCQTFARAREDLRRLNAGGFAGEVVETLGEPDCRRVRDWRRDEKIRADRIKEQEARTRTL